ncbi:hypothetical protein J2I47_17925 [Fibrella sp. HMF5335]|uniref:Uncharacterized protein n=1 Tax=Fibrella rubiginis TaxID=2817060 RepID=A0A939GJ69_9BACT|nr:hypothetical protein [Fibrella rubiginis]MBO0938435.1 hypothetical protein [Fibrella rubiginis]
MRSNMPALPDFFSRLNPAKPPESQLTQTLVGAINNTIPVTLTIITMGRLAHGTLTYTRSGIAIQVVGTLTGSELLLHEFDKKGTVTGIHVGEWSKSGYVGSWRSPSLPGRSLPFDLTVMSQHDGLRDKLADLTGLYQYSYGNRHRFAQLHVEQINEKTLAIAALAVTDEPVQNQMVVSKTIIKLVGSQATLSINRVAIVALTFAFFNGGTSVSFSGPTSVSTSNRPPILSADMLLGHYIRTSTRPPRFSEDELSRML